MQLRYALGGALLFGAALTFFSLTTKSMDETGRSPLSRGFTYWLWRSPGRSQRAPAD
jgi:hypothetical protein